LDVTVSSRHTEVPDNLRRVAEEKIGRLSRFLEGMDRAEVHFSEERNPRIADREVCEVTLEGHGHHVRCKVRATDGFVAVDRAVEKLESQLHKLKTKLKKRQHGSGLPSAADPPTELPEPLPAVADRAKPPSPEQRMPRVVKSKRFAKMAMTPEDAATRMGLVGHDFFFFTNIDTHRAAVVYRRDDGDVGLIDEDG